MESLVLPFQVLHDVWSNTALLDIFCAPNKQVCNKMSYWISSNLISLDNVAFFFIWKVSNFNSVFNDICIIWYVKAADIFHLWN